MHLTDTETREVMICVLGEWWQSHDLLFAVLSVGAVAAGVAVWLQISYNAEKRNAASANDKWQSTPTDEETGDHGRKPIICVTSKHSIVPPNIITTQDDQ